MTENFLHFIYKNRLWLDNTELLTDNTPFDIIDVGVHNHDSGPDFFNAKIKIDGVVWVGNVEIHVNASDWHKHHHDNDQAYSNVILHIVYNYDCDITIDNRILSTWEISFSPIVYNRYADFKINEKQIPCADYIGLIDQFHVTMCLEKLAIERLEQKAETLENYFIRTNKNWFETLYITLARNFGFGINSFPFEQLALQTPSSILLHNSDNIFILEAIIFGQAGMLDTQPKDDYTKQLSEEYAFQQKKYTLRPIAKSMWKRSKMLPYNFPEIRLSQFAAMIQHFQLLATNLLNNKIDLDFLYDLETSDYWKTHFSLGVKSSKQRKTNISKKTIDIILINTVFPFLYIYQKATNSLFDSETILTAMEKIPAESNREVRTFTDIEQISCTTAFHSQALLQLKKNYCDLRRCENCNIGYQIMKKLNSY